MSFEIGTRVRYTQSDSNIPVGTIGTVTPNRREYDNRTEVNFDGVENPPHYDGWLCGNSFLVQTEFAEGDYVEYVSTTNTHVLGAPKFGDRGYVLPSRSSESSNSVVVKWDSGLSAGTSDGGFSVGESSLIIIDAAPREENSTGEIQSVLDIAKKICYGDRNIDYGDPYDDYVKTAAFFSLILGSEVKPHQAAMMMICVKLSRLMHDPTKRDSIVDVAGYADVLDRIVRTEFA